jgi:HPr kinase/phosphorylase
LRRKWKGVSGVIFASGTNPTPVIKNEAEKRKIALLLAGASKKKCQEVVREYISSLSVSRMIIPGGLLRMFGLGVLITGDSGVGKSESALELISRGHKFISDDVCLVEKDRDGKIVGKAPRVSRHFMEVRGLGIIDIQKIFGSRAVCRQSRIGLVIELKKWEEGKEYDRLGLKSPQEFRVLGQKISRISLPVGPGRNISTLIEVACKVQYWRERGYRAPEEMLKRVDRVLGLE